MTGDNHVNHKAFAQEVMNDDEESMQIQICSFTPVTKRIRHDPQFIAIYAGMSPRAADQSASWVSVTAITHLPSIVRIPKSSKQLRLSFHCTKPHRYLGDATTCISNNLNDNRTNCIVIPVVHAKLSTDAVAVIFLRYSTTPITASISNIAESYNSAQMYDGGISLGVRTAPSMIRECKDVCAVVLSVVMMKNDGDDEHSWPLGRIPLARSVQKAGCIAISKEVVWFGEKQRPRRKKDGLKIEWMGGPKKGLTFVHGTVRVDFDALRSMKNGELLGMVWTEKPVAAPVKRSALVEHISFRDDVWYLDVSLTR